MKSSAQFTARKWSFLFYLRHHYPHVMVGIALPSLFAVLVILKHPGSAAHTPSSQVAGVLHRVEGQYFTTTVAKMEEQ